MEKETNSIYKGVGAIKYCNEDMSNKLYDMRDQKFDSFLDVINVFPGNSRQLEIMMKLHYFEEFGGSWKLLAMQHIHSTYHGKKILKKDKTTLPVDLIQKHMISESEKQYRFTPEAMDNLLREYCDLLQDEDMPLRNRLDAEAEYLGYISYTDPDLEKNIGFVINIDTKYSPKITMYMLATGETIVYKLPKKSYERNAFNKGDILKFNTINKPKSKLIDGRWIKDYSQMEEWIDNYILYNTI
jgi:DNA polymerase III alpha subunit